MALPVPAYRYRPTRGQPLVEAHLLASLELEADDAGGGSDHCRLPVTVSNEIVPRTGACGKVSRVTSPYRALRQCTSGRVSRRRSSLAV